MAIGDILAGFAQAGHEHQTNLIDLAYKQRDQLANAYSRLMQDESYPVEARQQFGQAFQDITTSDPFKLPQTIKKYQDMKISVTPPRSLRPVQPGPEVDQHLSLPPGSPGAPMGMEVPNIPAPQPPPGLMEEYQPPAEMRSLFAPKPFQDVLNQTRLQEKTKYETATEPAALLKLGVPTPTGNKGVRMDAKGDAYQVTQMKRLNPDTKEWEFYDQVSNAPLRHFAPRASGELNIEDAAGMQAQDPSMVFIDEGTKQPIDLKKVMATMPDATLRHTGSNEYQINSQKYKPITVGNVVSSAPQVPPSGGIAPSNMGPALGVARTGSQAAVEKEVGVNAQGEPQFGTLNATRTVPSPGITGAPTPPVSGPLPAQPIAPAAAPPVAPPVTSPAPPRAPLSTTTTTPPPTQKTSSKTRSFEGVLAPAELNRQRAIVMPIQEVAASLVGDPANPGAPTLESYGHYALDPKARTDIGAAVDMILHGAADSGGGNLGILGQIPVAGDALEWLRRQGITEKMSRAQVDAIQRVLSDPKESQVVHQIVATYGTIPGLRVATKGSAYQFYVKNLENEIPTFGNITSGGQFYEKLALLMRDVVNATSKTISTAVLPKEQFQRYQDAETRLWKLSRLSDEELRTVNVDGPDIQYRRGGKGPVVTLEGTGAPTPPKKKP